MASGSSNASARASFAPTRYTLLAAETLIIVNHMVRLAGLRFSPGPGGPADRQLRSAREKLYYIGLQTHYSLEACCSEDQSY